MRLGEEHNLARKPADRLVLCSDHGPARPLTSRDPGAPAARCLNGPLASVPRSTSRPPSYEPCAASWGAASVEIAAAQAGSLLLLTATRALDSSYAWTRRVSFGAIDQVCSSVACGTSQGKASADRRLNFIATSCFTVDAKAYVDRVQNRLVLIDGKRLAAEMVKRNMGVQVREVHEVKRIDEDFFAE
jgi:hypothetical protein